MERPDEAAAELVEQLRCSVELARQLGLEPDNLPLYHLTQQQLAASGAPAPAGEEAQ